MAYPYPKRLFPSQLREERVFVVARRHWVASLPILVPTGLLFFVPFIVIAIAGWAGGFVGLETWHRDAIILGTGAFLLFVGIIFMVGWMSYYFDFQIVTDRRVVDIDQHRLFAREINELTYDAIEDIKVYVRGFLGTYLDFGDIEIQTAAQYRNFILEKVPSPHKIARIITDLNAQSNRGVPPDDREPRGPIVGFINGQDILRTAHKPAVMNYERNLEGEMPQEAPPPLPSFPREEPPAKKEKLEEKLSPESSPLPPQAPPEESSSQRPISPSEKTDTFSSSEKEWQEIKPNDQE